MYIQRRALGEALRLLNHESFICVEGSPRCGLSTFATQIVKTDPGRFLLLDARGTMGRQVLSDPGQALAEISRGASTSNRVIVVDNADKETERQTRAAIAGATANDQNSYILLGRGFSGDAPGARLDLGPFSLPEVGSAARTTHWLRGGFPEAFAASSDAAASAWLARYADSISEERFAEAGLPWAPGRSRALLSMIAEAQGNPLNANAAARSLGVSRPTIARSVAALERIGLIRLLPALPSPQGRRVVRGASLYLRDSGLYHALLGLSSIEALLGSARLAASWEGYVIEQTLVSLPPDTTATRYATRTGAALELVLTPADKPPVAVSIRWARGRGPSRAAIAAAGELGAGPRWLILPETEEREIGEGFVALGLARFLELVAGD
jgi:predicted AAA+ superfamily ATPase